MQTNKTISTESDLHKKGKALLEAAYDYWEEYANQGLGPSAVVWLEADNGHFLLFTRSEYKQDIVAAARTVTSEEAMFTNPFGSERK